MMHYMSTKKEFMMTFKSRKLQILSHTMSIIWALTNTNQNRVLYLVDFEKEMSNIINVKYNTLI